MRILIGGGDNGLVEIEVIPIKNVFLSSGLGGGGGTGTVTSVEVSGSDGIEIDSGSPITTSGTIALGINATALRSHINVADGANNYTHPENHPPSIITQDASNRFVTDTEKSTWNAKQNALVSGTSIKTINGDTLLGSGDLNTYPEAVERENDTVLFDKNYVTGNTAVRTGNILFDFTGAKLGAVTRILHNSGTKPTIPSEGVLLSGAYELSVDNYIYFCITDIGTGTEKVEATVSQSQTW